MGHTKIIDYAQNLASIIRRTIRGKRNENSPLRLPKAAKKFQDQYVKIAHLIDNKKYQRAYELVHMILSEDASQELAYYHLFIIFNLRKTDKPEYEASLYAYSQDTAGKYLATYNAKFYRKYKDWPNWRLSLSQIPPLHKMRQFVQNEFYLLDIMEKFPIEDTIDQVNALNSVMEQISTSCFIDLIIEKYNTGKSCHYLRLGDGEGSIISAFNQYIPSKSIQRQALGQISKIMFGVGQLKTTDLKTIALPLQEAYLSADILNIPTPRRIEATASRIWRGYYGLASGIHYLYQNIKKLEGHHLIATSDCKEIASKENIQKLINSCPNIGIISCHDELLNIFYKLGAKDVHFITIPPQINSIPIEDRDRAPKLYPTEHNNILTQIKKCNAPRLYFVAAGIVAKQYCHELSKMGHIALDLGSSIDKWVGEDSRGNDTNKIDTKFNL